tara:strand:- start:118 stop:378 length:261 start_codon:yes stop_codon:yes gene_type:complete
MNRNDMIQYGLVVVVVVLVIIIGAMLFSGCVSGRSAEGTRVIAFDPCVMTTVRETTEAADSLLDVLWNIIEAVSPNLIADTYIVPE